MKYIFLILFLSSSLISQINYDDYFSNGSLRIDYYRTGNFEKDIYSLKEYFREKYFSGSKTNLIDDLNYGYNRVEVYDLSDNLIFAKNYSSLFLEWQKTDEAKLTPKTFEE